jgi:pyruvate formate lyase activating enzyme
MWGKQQSVAEVMKQVRKDHIYYELSGGGLTVSGGEPTMEFEFCRALLRAARNEGFHTCLDTCGQNETSKYLELIPYVSLFLWDYKATGAALHRKLTGVSPELIQQNFRALYERNASILVRAPLIPGINDSTEHLEAVARMARDYPNLAGIELLPYNDLGLGKFDRLHLERPTLDTRPASEKVKKRWRKFFHLNGDQSFEERTAPVSLAS